MVCVGIVVADPLRSIGLKSILEDGLKVRAVILPDGNQGRPCKPTILILEDSAESEPGPSSLVHPMLLRMPGVAVILLTRGQNLVSARKALAAGARAILPETAQIPEIRACIRAVARGKTWIPKETAAAEVEAGAPPEAKQTTLAERFTPKEREVLRWLAQGHSNREIAATMGIDEATVKAHLGRMLRKADASNRVELTLRALAGEKKRMERP